MVLQISRGVCAKIPLESDIRERRADIGPILRQLSEEKEAENVEAEACVDHIHVLVSILTHLSVAHGISQRKKYTYDIRPSHPVRGGTFLCGIARWFVHISIHPPRAGWDHGDLLSDRADRISIHPPRAGWDSNKLQKLLCNLCKINKDKSTSEPLQVSDKLHGTSGDI